MAGCQRGLSLSMLATHDYNNISTCTWNIRNNAKKRATASAKYEVQQDNVHTIQGVERNKKHGT